MTMNRRIQRGVVKIGGARGNAFGSLLEEIKERMERGEQWILAHGASSMMEDLSRAAGTEPLYVTSPGGFRSRFVSEGELALFEAACCRFSVQLAGTLGKMGIHAVPLYPPASKGAAAKRKDALRSVEDGKVRILRGNYSGSIVSFDPGDIHAVWEMGGLPVLPPLAADEALSGGILNVDGDRLAAAAAAAVGADVLAILSNVPGLLRDPGDPASKIDEGSLDGWDDLEHCARGNMKRKLLAAREALEGGAGAVVIADSRAPFPVESGLFGGGTLLCRGSMAAAG